MQKIWVVALLAGVILVSGCTSSSKSPKQQFRDLTAKAEDSTYHLEYSLSLGGGSETLSGLVDSMEVYSYEGDTKTLVTVSLLGSSSTTAIFHRDGRKISCSESSGLLRSEKSLECSINETSSSTISRHPNRYKGKLDNAELEVSGSKEVAGRECKMFVMHLNSTVTDSDQYESAEVGMCLDKGKGYTAYMKVNTTQSSELAGNTTTTLLSMKVESYDEQVSKSDVALPRKLNVEAECNPLKAELVSLGYSGTAEVAVNGTGNRKQVELEKWGRETVEFESVSGVDSKQVIVEAGEKTYSAECSAFGLGDLDTDFNLSSDYGSSDYNSSEY